MTTQIHEALAASVAPSTPGKIKVGLITPGIGSSGYYSAQVLENAANDKVWPKGTHIFFDHPSESELYDRPERSVRDLAAVLSEDAYWDGEGLVAEADVIGPYRELVTDPVFVESVGMSIRATAESRAGEVDGKKCTVITQLVEGLSVDLVTRAGRGGRVMAVLESARRGVREATANDTRDALQGELTETYGGDKTWIWVRDFDDTTVWYQLETPDGSATYAEGFTIDDATNQVTLDGAQVEVTVRTQYVPVPPEAADAGATAESGTTTVPAPAGQPHPTHSSKEDTMGNIQVDEAQHASLTEAAGRVPTLESERDTFKQERDASRRELALYKVREAARPTVAAKVGESNLPATRKARIVESVLRQVAVDENGAPNAEALVKITEAEVTEAEVEIAELAEAMGVGQVIGFGGSSRFNGSGEVTEADADKAIAGAFGRQIKEA